MSYLKQYHQNQSQSAASISSYYINQADKRWQKQGQKNRHAYLLQRVLNLANIKLDKCLNVMEIGGGDGTFLTLENDHLVKTLVDIDNYFEGPLTARGIKFAKCDLSSDEPNIFKNDEFDLIAMNHVIEHIWHIETLMAQVKRMLKKGGYMYIRTPDIERVGMKFFDDYTHVRPFSKAGLKHLFSVHGFELVHMQNTNNRLLQIADYPGIKLQNFGKEIEAIFKAI